MLLAIDTCTERMIVALRDSDSDAWVNLDAQGNHAREILPAIESLLKGRRPTVMGVALGPGSFTGVRIGLATAKGLAEGWGLPLVGLDNLSAMADAWQRLTSDTESFVLPVIDARKKKFYGALYRQGVEVLEPADRSASDWLSQSAGRRPVVLSGFQGSLLAAALGPELPEDWTVLDTLDWAPGLLDQLATGWREQRFLPANAAPRYLRLSEAEESLSSRKCLQSHLSPGTKV